MSKRKLVTEDEPIKKSKDDVWKGFFQNSKPVEKKIESSDTVATEKKEIVAKVEAPTDIKPSLINPKIVLKGQKESKDKVMYDYASYNPLSISYTTHCPYGVLCNTLNEVANNGSRIKKTELLTNFFRTIILTSPNDLLSAVYLCSNQLAPTYEGIELGIGDSILSKAIGESYGLNLADVKKMNTKLGDLGLVGKQARNNQTTMMQPRALNIQDVYKAFLFIATSQGKDSQKKKIGKIQSLLVACRDPLETLFLIRFLQSKLRIGLAEQTILTSLAHAILLTRPKEKIEITIDDLHEVEEVCKTVYCELPSYAMIIPEILKNGFDILENLHLTCGIGVKPMLAKRTTSVNEIFSKFSGDPFTCEYKYDGERAQIHWNNGKMSIYSRNLENHTEKYPDVEQIIKKLNIQDNFILDCEIVAFKDGAILPFQTLMTRKKKDISINDIKIKVCVYAFDLLYFKESLLKEPLETRRNILMKEFAPIKDEFQYSTSFVSTDPEQIQDFLNQSIKNLCEGIMIKRLTSTYEPSRRSNNWLKLKKDYLEGIGDSLDLVVIGGYNGQGKRVGVYGGFLLAIYNPDSDEYESCCKIGTGFSDEQLTQICETLKSCVIDDPKPYYKYDNGHVPDVWFETDQVWEVKCADLTLSPKHMAGIGIIEDDKGIALRFPRFVRFRPDKKPEDATTSDQIAEMYQNQVNKQTN